MRELPQLIEAVQRNCHIADARHARDLTLCSYLLEMREFYRWEHELPLTAQPPKSELSAWLAAREALWAELEEEEFGALPLAAREVAPFDDAAANAQLLPRGLVYGGGIGRFGKPHFFLGRLARRELRDGMEVLVVDCEYARDLTGLPAAMRDGRIVLRREALKRWLWEKAEVWGVKQADGPLAAALAAYGFAAEPMAALERMTDHEAETLILHELGEAEAGRLLGEDWERMLARFTRRRAELVARAVRDNLADCLVTLPTLLDRGDEPSLHFWFANFEGLRRSLFPSLEAAYRRWRAEGERGPIAAAAERGRDHWTSAAQRLLAIADSLPEQAQTRIEALAADNSPALAL